MVGRGNDGNGKGGAGGPERTEKVIDFPNAQVKRRRHEFCDAVGRLKAALSEARTVPVPTRQALVAELGRFDTWLEEGVLLPPAIDWGREFARQILLLDYRLSALGPLAGRLDPSLCHAVRQYAEASNLLLETAMRRGPEGEWLHRPRRTEIERLVLALCGKPRPGGGADGD